MTQPTPQELGLKLLNLIDQPCLTPQEELAAYRLATGGADLETRRPDDPDTALIIAVWMGHAELVHTLIYKNADVNARGQHGETALMRAVFDKNPGMVEVLLKAGADPDLRDDNGRTALDFSRQGRTPEIGTILRDAMFKRQHENDKLRDKFYIYAESGIPLQKSLPISRKMTKRKPPGDAP